MNLLIKSARILDSNSSHHNTVKDILIENGTISSISNTISNTHNYREINLDNLHISQGWLDTSVSFGEPGFEERETLSNGLKTSGLSGFTEILVNPNTQPVVDNNTTVEFLKQKAFGTATSLHSIGALTKGQKGSDLAELYDMKNSGAVAFGDYQTPIDNPNLLKVALQYVQSFNGLVLSFPNTKTIAGKGVVNEGINSTLQGLKGIPSLGENLQIARDLFLLDYTEGKLHIPKISSEKSVELIRDAKAKGLDVTCSVPLANLIFTDDAFESFNTNFKVLPPLRTKSDQTALIEGVKDGTIDFVTTNHAPVDIEFKKIEFDYAQYGTIGLEVAFGVLQTIFPTETTIDILTRHKSRFNLNQNIIEEGQKASMTLFDPNVSFRVSEEHLLSTSKNCAFLGLDLVGRAYGIINNDVILISE